MKLSVIIFIITALALGACTATQSLSSYNGDDLYYTPSPTISYEDVTFKNERKQRVDSREVADATREYQASQNDFREIDLSHYRQDNGSIDVSRLAADLSKSDSLLMTTHREVVDNSSGKWLQGFKGSERDLEEAYRVINQYPQGFGSFGNDYEIAMSLSFNTDWNVYSRNNKYWWFPSNTNIEWYSQFLMGNFPKYAYIRVWDNPSFDSWDFDYVFNSSWGYGYPRNRFSFSWNYGWYDPWDRWYGPSWGYNGFCDFHNFHHHYHPGHWSCYNPYWHGYHPHWGGHYPGYHKPHYKPSLPNWGPPAHANIPKPRPGHSTALRPTTSNRYPAQTNTSRPIYNSKDKMYRPSTSGGKRPTVTTRPTNSNRRPTIFHPTNSNRSTRTNYNRSNNTYQRSTGTNYQRSNTYQRSSGTSYQRGSSSQRSNSYQRSSGGSYQRRR